MGAWQDIPPEFLESARKRTAGYHIDAELAQVTYDSAHDLDTAAGLRSGPASTCVLTFASAHVTIELESGEEALLGQIVPAAPGLSRSRPPTGHRDHSGG